MDFFRDIIRWGGPRCFLPLQHCREKTGQKEEVQAVLRKEQKAQFLKLVHKINGASLGLRRAPGVSTCLRALSQG